MMNVFKSVSHIPYLKKAIELYENSLKKKPAKKAPAKKAPAKKAPKKKKTFEEESDELDKAIKKYRDKVENHKDILDIDYETSRKYHTYNAYRFLLNNMTTGVTGTFPERTEQYKKKLDYADEVIETNKIKVEKFKEDLRKVTNDWYGELFKIEKKVLNGSLKDFSNEYEEEYEIADEDFNDELIKVNKKNNFEYKYNNEDSYFYEPLGNRKKNILADNLKKDVIDFRSLKNWKLFYYVGEDEEDGEPVEIKRKTDKSNKLDIVTKQDILDLNKSKPKEKEIKKPNAWKLHLQKFRKENPNITGKDVMKEAKKTYKKSSLTGSTSKPSKKKEIIKKDDLSKLPPPPDKFFDKDYIELLKKEEKKLEKNNSSELLEDIKASYNKFNKDFTFIANSDMTKKDKESAMSDVFNKAITYNQFVFDEYEEKRQYWIHQVIGSKINKIYYVVIYQGYDYTNDGYYVHRKFNDKKKALDYIKKRKDKIWKRYVDNK